MELYTEKVGRRRSFDLDCRSLEGGSRLRSEVWGYAAEARRKT